MAMDPKDLTDEERFQLELVAKQDRMSQMLFEARNRILRTAQNKAHQIIKDAAPSDQALMTQAAFEACVIMTLKFEEDLRGMGMPSLLLAQTKTEAIGMGIESLLAPTPAAGGGIYIPGGKGGS